MSAEQPTALPTDGRINRLTWLRFLLSLLLGGLSLWLITRSLNLADIENALRQARGGPILLALLVILVTMLAKTWRWQLLFASHDQPPALQALFPPLILGQFINALSPIRLGDLARIYAAQRPASISKVELLSTLLIEKTFDAIILALTLLLLLPLVTLPQVALDNGYALTLAALLALIILALLAYRSEQMLRLVQKFAVYLPTRWQERSLRLVRASLAGLAALRDPRRTLFLLLISAFIMFLSVLTPWVLFQALALPLGWQEATVLHVALIVGLIPATTPANVGIFEGLVVFLLHRFGIVDEALMLGYAIIYHLVVVTPQIILGALALALNRSLADILTKIVRGR